MRVVHGTVEERVMSEKPHNVGEGVVVDALFKCGECNGAGKVASGHTRTTWNQYRTCVACLGYGYEGGPPIERLHEVAELLAKRGAS